MRKPDHLALIEQIRKTEEPLALIPPPPSDSALPKNAQEAEEAFDAEYKKLTATIECLYYVLDHHYNYQGGEVLTGDLKPGRNAEVLRLLAFGSLLDRLLKTLILTHITARQKKVPQKDAFAYYCGKKQTISGKKVCQSLRNAIPTRDEIIATFSPHLIHTALMRMEEPVAHEAAPLWATASALNNPKSEHGIRDKVGFEAPQRTYAQMLAMYSREMTSQEFAEATGCIDGKGVAYTIRKEETTEEERFTRNKRVAKVLKEEHREKTKSLSPEAVLLNKLTEEDIEVSGLNPQEREYIELIRDGLNDDNDLTGYGGNRKVASMLGWTPEHVGNIRCTAFKKIRKNF